MLVGLLLYNFLYAAVGATVNRPEEALVASFPLTAPLTMPSRIASGGGSPIEVVLAFVLALLALVGVISLAARIYAGGVLQSSKVGLLTAFRRARDIRCDLREGICRIRRRPRNAGPPGTGTEAASVGPRTP